VNIVVHAGVEGWKPENSLNFPAREYTHLNLEQYEGDYSKFFQAYKSMLMTAEWADTGAEGGAVAPGSAAAAK